MASYKRVGIAGCQAQCGISQLPDAVVSCAIAHVEKCRVAYYFKTIQCSRKQRRSSTHQLSFGKSKRRAEGVPTGLEHIRSRDTYIARGHVDRKSTRLNSS